MGGLNDELFDRDGFETRPQKFGDGGQGVFAGGHGKSCRKFGKISYIC